MSAVRGNVGAESFVRRLLRATFKATFVSVLVLSLLIGFGISRGDQTRLATFVDSVEQWQANTEFRQVASQYVTRGSDAMRTRPMGFRSASWILWIRSLPFMPAEFAVNDTSRAHYENFSKGPLSAYLHLCTEVELLNPDGTGGYLGEFESRFGKSAQPTDAEVRQWLESLKWDYKVVSDAGAVQSLQLAITDVEPYKPFAHRVRHIDGLLKPHIRDIAAGLKLPQEVDDMSPMQQYAVIDRLDSYLRQHDRELWRTKQVSDVCGGIWGQVFSPPYLMLLGPYLQVVEICRWIAVALLAVLVWAGFRRARQVVRDMEGASQAGEDRPNEQVMAADPA